MATEKKTYLVEMFDPPHWVKVLGPTHDLEYAIAFAREIDGKKRVTEYPGGKDVPLESPE